MTCPGCGCTVGCECSGLGGLAAAEEADSGLQAAAAYGLAVLSRLSQVPAPFEGERSYAARALETLRGMLHAAGRLDQVEARVQDLPRRLLS